MQTGKFNVVTDGQHGSTGKGLISAALASVYFPDILSTTNLPNAGHTAVSNTGAKFIAKALPAPAIVRKWISGYNPHIVIGASAAFDLDQLHKEIGETGSEGHITIHPRAGIITEEHKQREIADKTGPKHIASTLQGCGTYMSDKVMRRKELKLARDYPELAGHMPEHMHKKIKTTITETSLPLILKELMALGQTILHEGSQGFSLDINHGSHFPNCTSRSTTAIQNLADMGLNHNDIGDIYLVFRPYPIRVGNIVENGQTVGYSGDCYPDNDEITWSDVAKASGAPPEVTAGELTTVTKRIRRVFTFSKIQLREAAIINGATKLALNFANYIDWSCYGTNDSKNLPPKVMDFIKMVEDLTGIPVAIVGTGPQNNHVCYM